MSGLTRAQVNTNGTIVLEYRSSRVIAVLLAARIGDFVCAGEPCCDSVSPSCVEYPGSTPLIRFRTHLVKSELVMRPIANLYVTECPRTWP
jgi:hypothetical protein